MMIGRYSAVAPRIASLLLSVALAGCATTPIDAWWQLKSAPAGLLAKRHSKADVVVLRKHVERTMHFSRDFRYDHLIARHHTALMIVTERGLRRADWQVRYHESSKLLYFTARVVHPSGRTELLRQEDVHEDTAFQKKDGGKWILRVFALPRVKVGDIVEVQYAVKTKQRLYHQEGYLHGSDPVLDFSSVHRFTRGATRQTFKLYNHDGRGWTKEVRGDHDVVSLRLRNLPAYVPETWSPPKRSFVPRFVLTVAVRKVDLVEYPIYREWKDTIKRTHYFACLFGKFSKSLLRGFVTPERAMHSGTARERIAATLRWVRDEVTFGAFEKFAPRPLRYVVSDGNADDYEKTMLLLYALRHQKLAAEFALVRPRNYGTLDTSLPAPGQFAEAVVFVPAQRGIDRPLWIAPYCHHCRLGELPSTMIGEPALIVRAARKSADEMEPRVKLEKVAGKHPAPATVMRRTTVRLRPDGSATGEVRWRSHGRVTNKAARSFGRAKAKLARVLAWLVPGSTLGDFDSKISRSVDLPGKVDARFTANSLGLPAGPNKLTVPLTPLRLPFKIKDSQRHNPIWIRDGKRYRHRVRIVPPAGYRVVAPELPGPLTTKFGKVTFAVVTSTESADEKPPGERQGSEAAASAARKLPDGAIEVSVDAELAAGTHPADQIVAFRRFLRRADDASRLLVSLIKVSPRGS